MAIFTSTRKKRGLYKRSFINLFLLVIKKDKKMLVGTIIVLLYVLAAILSLFIPVDLSPHIEERDQPPSLNHLLGTDYAGRDNFSMIIHGSYEVLIVASLTAVIVTFVAMTIGLTSGFVGGTVDVILMRIADIALTIPGFPLIYVLAFLLKDLANNYLVQASILSVTAWAGLARAIRSQVLSLKEKEFVEAARLLGLSKLHIIFREILPNIMPYIVVNAILAVSYAIYSQVGLYFLGVLPYSPCNWGLMLNLAFGEKQAIYGVSTGRIWQLISPILAISLIQIGLIMFSSGVEKILNPRLLEE